MCAAATCSDGVKNGNETDTDCGGSCKGCATGKVCAKPADCATGACSGSVCVGPTGGMIIWYKADALSGLSNGSKVSTWTDSSGKGNHAVQPISARRPTYYTGVLNGKPTVRFDGFDDVLPIRGTQVVTHFSMFLVYRMTSGSTVSSYYPFMMGGPANVTGRYVGLETRNAHSGNSANLLDIFAGFSNDARASYSGISAFGAFKLISSVTSGKIHSTTVRVNGANASMSGTGANVSMYVTIGNSAGTGFGGVGGIGLQSFGKHQFKGDIAEIIVYASAMGTATRNSVEAYLRAKYKVY